MKDRPLRKYGYVFLAIHSEKPNSNVEYGYVLCIFEISL